MCFRPPFFFVPSLIHNYCEQIRPAALKHLSREEKEIDNQLNSRLGFLSSRTQRYYNTCTCSLFFCALEKGCSFLIAIRSILIELSYISLNCLEATVGSLRCYQTYTILSEISCYYVLEKSSLRFVSILYSLITQ